MIKIFIIVVVPFLSGCFIYQPDLTEKHKATELIDHGVIALRQGDLESAEATFEAAYEVGHLPQALDGMGSVALLKGDLDRAERFFRAAYNQDPSYPNALGNLALVYEQRGDIVTAKNLYHQAIREDPANGRIRGNYSVFLAENNSESSYLARKELLKARALVDAPLVEYNLKNLIEKD